MHNYLGNFVSAFIRCTQLLLVAKKGQIVPCLKFLRRSIRIGDNIANFQKKSSTADIFINTEKRSFTRVPYLSDLISYRLTFRKKKHVTHRRINFGSLVFTSTVSCPSNPPYISTVSDTLIIASINGGKQRIYQQRGLLYVFAIEFNKRISRLFRFRGSSSGAACAIYCEDLGA